MSLTFTSRMPAMPPRQKHSPPKRSDTVGFLSSLKGDQFADGNLNWFWNDPKDHTEESGGLAYGAHYLSPGPNGYISIEDRPGHVRPLKPGERHKTDWPASVVQDWHRGKTARSAHPDTYWHLLAYLSANGGHMLGELKTPAFGTYPWIMEQLVANARHHNQPPWFKALFNMRLVEQKCANTINAGGQFALIFGNHVKGSAKRERLGREITADWAIKPTRIW